jgi:hypothetical protein
LPNVFIKEKPLSRMIDIATFIKLNFIKKAAISIILERKTSLFFTKIKKKTRFIIIKHRFLNNFFPEGRGGGGGGAPTKMWVGKQFNSILGIHAFY